MNARLLVRGAAGREGLLRTAARFLEAGEVLVRAEDVYRADGATLTVPFDAAAVAVAREDPLVRADGSTVLVSYLRVRRGATGAVRWALAADGLRGAGTLELEVVAEGR